MSGFWIEYRSRSYWKNHEYRVTCNGTVAVIQQRKKGREQWQKQKELPYDYWRMIYNYYELKYLVNQSPEFVVRLIYKQAKVKD